jgi:hypothetical protein
MTGGASPPSAFEPVHVSVGSGFDPFRLCVYTTIGLLAWLLSPALIVVAFSGTALVAYARARRAGLTRSRCKLGDTRVVMAYLAAAFALGVWGTVRAVAALM